MLATGARFADNLYIYTSFDPDNGDCDVTVEFITDEGAKQTLHGTVTWEDAKGKDNDDEKEPVEKEDVESVKEQPAETKSRKK